MMYDRDADFSPSQYHPKDTFELAQMLYDELFEVQSQCVDCDMPFNKETVHLFEFDHVDEEQKAGVVGFMLAGGEHTLEEIKAEASKCEIVCIECHKERTRRHPFRASKKEVLRIATFVDWQDEPIMTTRINTRAIVARQMKEQRAFVKEYVRDIIQKAVDTQ
jgi:hypothetical protein